MLGRTLSAIAENDEYWRKRSRRTARGRVVEGRKSVEEGVELVRGVRGDE